MKVLFFSNPESPFSISLLPSVEWAEEEGDRVRIDFMKDYFGSA
jgi:hypothetical protein